jgi:hypothetical protein
LSIPLLAGILNIRGYPHACVELAFVVVEEAASVVGPLTLDQGTRGRGKRRQRRGLKARVSLGKFLWALLVGLLLGLICVSLVSLSFSG